MTTALVVAGPLRSHRKAKPQVAKATKVVEAKATGNLKVCRVAELRVLCKLQSLKSTTKHTRGELEKMLTLGIYIRPAALDRQNAARSAKR